MWPFPSKKEREFVYTFRESRKPKETTPEEDWDVSLWLLDPDRTVEELDYFAETGQRPTRFTKLTYKFIPTDTPSVVEYTDKFTEEGKPRINFPPNPLLRDTYLEKESGTYYVWTGTKWKVLANTPPQAEKKPRTKEGIKGVILNLKRPVFKDQLEEKQWCAREVSLLLGCNIEVFERVGVGYIVIDGKEIRHPIENWDWHGKTTEEFLEHLYRLWVRQSQPRSSLDYLI